MTTPLYTDYAFDAPDAASFLPFMATEPNIIGPMLGRAEVGADPTRFYIKIRTPNLLTAPESASVTDTALATALLGVWA